MASLMPAPADGWWVCGFVSSERPLWVDMRAPVDRRPARPPARRRSEPMGTLPKLGWREWVGLPDHGLDWVKAKVDTGARTSALHAARLVTFDDGGEEWVRFRIYPWQRSTVDAVTIEAPVLDRRLVRSSSGVAQLRPVVVLP
ncbi:MAG TPA: hypothetical protein DDZ64_10910, partial [Acidimicrobiaceae bacterium]|nr:hypothetical protein [Acidimicrobiaceae bacterium]